MIPIQVNDYQFLVKSNLSIIEACKCIGIIIPRFCYHEKLSVAASCRMCVVELDKVPKPITACSADISANLIFFTNTPFVKKARENILEALLLNHPLDCPICDQAGECDLQDQVTVFGSSYSRFYTDSKRAVEDKYCGVLIKTIMTRCIHCTRCVRFGSEIIGIDFLGTLNRGISTEIGGYISKSFTSEISGNLIDLCPVGALTANPYFFKNRPWELRTIDTIDTLDSLGSNIYLNYKESNIVRILPKVNEDLNENLITDKTRFGFDGLSSKNRLQEYFSKIFDLNSSKKNFPSNIQTKLHKLFLINESLDLELNFLLNSLTSLDQNFRLHSIENAKTNTNLHLSWNFNSVKDLYSDIKTCFLFTSNIRVENALLNTKLRVKFFNKNFNIVGFGLVFKSNYAVRFLNITVKNIVSLFEGKNFALGANLFKDKTPVFFFGESFHRRFSASSLSFFSHIKTYFPTAILYTLNNSSNTSTILYLNVKPINKNIINKSSFYALYNLEANYKIQAILDNSFVSNLGKTILLFNSYKSSLNQILEFFKEDINTSLMTIPVPHCLESEGIFLNLEERPQQTQTLRNSSSLSSLKNVIKAFILNLKGFLSQSHTLLVLENKEYIFYSPITKIESFPELKFIFELSRNFNLFDSIKKTFSSLLILKFNSPNFSFRCFKYPFKSAFEDFYLTNSLLKNSLTMLECSRESRKVFDNF